MFLTSGGWNSGIPLYTVVYSFQVVGIEEFYCTQRCPHFRKLSSTVYRGVLISGCWNRLDVPLLNRNKYINIIRFHLEDLVHSHPACLEIAQTNLPMSWLILSHPLKSHLAPRCSQISSGVVQVR